MRHLNMRENYYAQVGGQHMFRYIGGPIDTPEQYPALFFDYGLAAASWARMEQHIDAILVQINKEDHSDNLLDLYDERHPGTFDQKLKMLRRYFNNHPGLAKYTEDVLDCATGLKRLSKDRNELLHGILEGVDSVAGTIMLNGMQYRNATNDFLNRHQTFPAGKLKAFAELVNMAHFKLCGVSKELFSVDGVAQLQRPRQLTRRWWRRILDRLRC